MVLITIVHGFRMNANDGNIPVAFQDDILLRQILSVDFRMRDFESERNIHR
jgi:hypothetical protein